MIYLKHFKLLNEEKENEIACIINERHNSFYPLHIFPEKKLKEINFEPITIIYGGNGSGKTTLLNIIAASLKASKKTFYDLGDIFDNYVEYCRLFMDFDETDCLEVKFISSDDIFDALLDMRAINSGVNRTKERLSREYQNYKFNPNKDLDVINDYEEFKNMVAIRKMSESKYVRTRLRNNTFIQESNGETALDFWQKEIKEDSLYIIDEPENSLSADNQLKLMTFIQESARFYNCQFIISTHSPFLLSLKDALIYDLDEEPVITKKWSELENVKVYYNFFKEYESDFLNQ